MGWSGNISRFFRNKQPSSEEILISSLIKDINRQIKNIEKQRRRLTKKEDSLKSGKKKKEEDVRQKLFECEEENIYLGERLIILRKKLALAQARFHEFTL